MCYYWALPQYCNQWPKAVLHPNDWWSTKRSRTQFWLSVINTPYSKMATRRKKLARVKQKRGHKDQVSFSYRFAFIILCVKKTSLKAKRNCNYFVNVHWLTFLFHPNWPLWPRFRATRASCFPLGGHFGIRCMKSRQGRSNITYLKITGNEKNKYLFVNKTHGCHFDTGAPQITNVETMMRA